MITFEKLSLKYYDDIKYLLSQLTIVGDDSKNGYNKSNFEFFISNIPYNQHIYIMLKNKVPVGMGTIIIENKIIHNFGKVGHIEDIVIDKNFRGMNLGKELINFLKNIAIKNNCYKIILNCSEKVKKFYEKSDFINEGYMMVIRYDKKINIIHNNE